MRKLVLMLILLTGLAPSAWAATVKTTHTTINSWDGTPLGAFVIEPQDAGSGRFPLLVMPSSWAVPSAEYVGVAQALARRGYIVISYSSRGFWESGGNIDIAGPATVEDVSALIDWALDNTRADPARIGVSGISYGAGTSLLAAARDPRIKVVAALSGWADLEASLYSNRTPSAQGIALLVAAGLATGRPGSELATINRNVLLGNFQGAVDSLLPVAAQRSPASSVDEINANRPAVFLANAFNDSLFPPGQLVDFFNRLQGPKQLQLRHGDHALNELLGALGIPNEVYEQAGDWFDHYLKGVDNGIDRQAAVQLKSQKGLWSRYPSWQATGKGAVSYALTAPGGLLLPTGGLAENGRSTGWNYRIGSGLLTAANSGVAMASGALQMINLPPGAYIPFVGRNAAGVWQGPVQWSARRLDGTPELRVTVTPSRANTTLYAYLYAEDVLGNGQLISHKPYTLRDATPGQAQTLDLRLEASSWNLPAGSRLTLVIDTVDLRYAGISQLGGAVTFSSPAASPSLLKVPLH
ncbi:MAG: prolyl oligopeptidase family serine peptidase [Stenotrophomonas sp.]|jgi:predicted acyl esterase|uniref:CocE/NonD family hydrolase n=1 Tax=Stenotrophomonas sp. TaxID=69392 RepID=UPI0028477DC2|nr:CocE/NonD family hydrolase [Stenotrophomonas sp.]MDR2961756.1 prolyl oligopeptidase family serine peptidase [Stenotrophomonas sp.]